MSNRVSRYCFFLVAAALFSGKATIAQESTLFAEGAVSFHDSSVFRGSFSPDGNSFYFFRKVAPTWEQYRIFKSVKLGEEWSIPVQLDFSGTEESELYPNVSPDGNWIVYSSGR